jgi:hypothetical protein
MESNLSAVRQAAMRSAGRILIAAVTVLFAGACHEIPQNAKKPFAGEKARELYSGERFESDKARFESALANRAQHQNEYLRMHGAEAP